MCEDILKFIKACITRRKIFWTYHVNMRLKERFIPRETLLSSVDSFEIIEEYPADKYLPSYLVYSEYGGRIIHILAAVDAANDSIRIVTAYEPAKDKWEEDFKTRRKP